MTNGKSSAVSPIDWPQWVQLFLAIGCVLLLSACGGGRQEAPAPQPKIILHANPAPQPVPAIPQQTTVPPKAEPESKRVPEKSAPKASPNRVSQTNTEMVLRQEANRQAAVEAQAALDAQVKRAELAEAEAAAEEKAKIAAETQAKAFADAEAKAAAEEKARIAAETQAKAVADAEAKAAAEEKAKIAAEAQAKAVADGKVRTAAEAARIAAIVVAAPVIAAPGVLANDVISVVIDESTPEALISWTIDGSDPGPENGARYTAPIQITSTSLLKVRAFVIGGQSSEVVSSDYAIGEIFVAPGGRGAGTRSAPLGCIGDALLKATELKIHKISLAAGTFKEAILLSMPIEISGGWTADFTRLSTERTIIQGPAATSSSKKAPASALIIRGTSAGKDLILRHVDFRGGEADYSAGITIGDSASPTLVDCRASGGPSSYGYGAIVSAKAAPQFHSCRFEGGMGATSYGLSTDSASVEAESSFFLAGNGTVGGYGLSSISSSIVIKNSVLAAKNANVGFGAAFYGTKSASLTKCTIVGGSGTEATGILVSASSPSIISCVIAASGETKSYGIYANFGDSRPKIVMGSIFVGCSGGYYYDAMTRQAYGAFSKDGRPANSKGTILPRVQTGQLSAAPFALGPEPSFALPMGAPAGIGAGL